MQIYNHLPLLIKCLHQWKTAPTEQQFLNDYFKPISETTGRFFQRFHESILDLDWEKYREHALKLVPEEQEARLRKHLADIENLFKFKLEGEVFLVGTFEDMDGYARFDRGSHKVYLGVDENYHRPYIDILMTHELTHVARESRPEVWEGFGLNPKMTQKEFQLYQPVIEHLMGEGFSCVVSEILVPREDPWDYVYQTKESLADLYKRGPELDRFVKKQLKDPDGDYGHYYGFHPVFAHYYWAMNWVKKVMHDFAGGDPQKLVTMSSKDFIEHALKFEV